MKAVFAELPTESLHVWTLGVFDPSRQHWFELHVKICEA